MGNDKVKDKENFKVRLKRFIKGTPGKKEQLPASLTSPSGSDRLAVNSETALPSEGASNQLPPSQQGEKIPTLWEEAAKSLEPEDRERLEVIIKSKLEGQAIDEHSQAQASSLSTIEDGRAPPTNAEVVASVLSRAQKLKDQDKQGQWGHVSSTLSRDLHELHSEYPLETR
jgi:hypothetical protein